VADDYDDPAFSGGNMERLALRRLDVLPNPITLFDLAGWTRLRCGMASSIV
jgi:ABC-type thiamine transport system ATPase subunit